MNRLLNAIIIVLFSIGILGSGNLVLEEVKTGNGCPKFWIVPFCLIILICFVVPLIVHLLKKWNLVYFLFTGIAITIALIASVIQLTGNGECPKTDTGLPMCYVSFLIFSLLILIKTLLLKKKH